MLITHKQPVLPDSSDSDNVKISIISERIQSFFNCITDRSNLY